MDKPKLGTGSVPVRSGGHGIRERGIVDKSRNYCWLAADRSRPTRTASKSLASNRLNSKYGRINYYISPKLLYEQTGYVWEGKK